MSNFRKSTHIFTISFENPLEKHFQFFPYFLIFRKLFQFFFSVKIILEYSKYIFFLISHISQSFSIDTIPNEQHFILIYIDSNIHIYYFLYNINSTVPTQNIIVECKPTNIKLLNKFTIPY